MTRVPPLSGGEISVLLSLDDLCPARCCRDSLSIDLDMTEPWCHTVVGPSPRSSMAPDGNRSRVLNSAIYPLMNEVSAANY